MLKKSLPSVINVFGYIASAEGAVNMPKKSL